MTLGSLPLTTEEKEKEVPDIDDTDGLEPDAEFEAWRLRELARIKRDKEDEVRREVEREEIERRRALPEEQRLKEDMERANKTREEKPKGQQQFLQKYWHKGAFHQVRFTSLFAFSHSHVFRTKTSSKNTTIQKQPSQPSMSVCYPRSCKSGTSESAVEQNTLIWLIKIQQLEMVDSEVSKP